MNLPDRPSELLRVALDDLRKCEADPRFKIDMSQWVMPQDGVCYVCLAGSVMIQELGASPKIGCLPSHFSEEVSDKLDALNEFRMGFIDAAYESLGQELPENLPEGIRVTRYNDDKEQFHKDMESLIKLLQEHGE